MSQVKFTPYQANDTRGANSLRGTFGKDLASTSFKTLNAKVFDKQTRLEYANFSKGAHFNISGPCKCSPDITVSSHNDKVNCRDLPRSEGQFRGSLDKAHC